MTSQDKIRALKIVCVTACILALIILSGCATISCSPNPNSMCHMSAKELNERLGL